MRDSVEIPYNEKYEKTPFYPRQKKKLHRLVRSMEERGIQPKLTGIEIVGKDNLKVIGHIADQISDRIGKVTDRRFVLCFGDGGNLVFNSALLMNLGDDRLNNALVVADGGTMSNLSNTLKTADPEVAAGVVKGDVPFVVANLRIREAEVTIYDSAGRSVKTLTYPWTCSVGTKIGGDIISNWEGHPRSRNPFVNLALSLWKILKDTVQKHGNGQPLQGHSVTTLENIGFFRFDEKYTDLEGDKMHHSSFESKFGWEAMKRIAVYAVVCHIPALSRRVWTGNSEDTGNGRNSSILRIAAEIEPHAVTRLTLDADWTYPNIHLDGTPVRMKEIGLEEGGRAEIELRSTDRSIPVARVVS